MSFYGKIYKALTKQTWGLGFTETPLRDIVEGRPIEWSWVVNPWKDRWFADPFILDYSNTEIIVLAEEYWDRIGRGRIAKITISRSTMEIKDVKVILDLPTHLSFPAIERRDGALFIHPENSASGKHYIYKYNPYTDNISEGKVICDEPLTDAVLLDIEDERYLFSTQIPRQNGNVLERYRFDEKTGKYKKKDEYIFPDNIARMAGDIFEVNGKIYRPAQDCCKCYGEAIILQEMICKDGKFDFKNVRRLVSDHEWLNTGMHTFNRYKDIVVIDVHGYRKPFISSCFVKMDSFKNKLIRKR